MIDIKSTTNFKEDVSLITCKGNLDEVIGTNAKAPSWVNISKINGNSKYEGTTQIINTNFDDELIELPSLDTEDFDIENSIEYAIHKEVLQVFIHNDLPFEDSIKLPFEVDNIDIDDRLIILLLFKIFR